MVRVEDRELAWTGEEVMKIDSQNFMFKTHLEKWMEEKLSDAESETQVLRQQALEMTQKLSNAELEIREMAQKLINAKSELLRLRRQARTMTPIAKPVPVQSKAMIVQSCPENGHVQNGEAIPVPSLITAIAACIILVHKYLDEKQQELLDLLVKCIAENLGFSKGKPIAACIIYKCLLHWRFFKVERTDIFDRIIEIIMAATEVEENIDILAYWLSNLFTLSLLLQQTFKVPGTAINATQRRWTMPITSLFVIKSSLKPSPQSPVLSVLNERLSKPDDFRLVKAKYPALVFKQQLSAYLEKIYSMIRDKLKKMISSKISLCIEAQAPFLKEGRTYDPLAHWQTMVKILNDALKSMRENYVPPILVRNVFSKVFLFLNAHIFNSLLLRRECCSFSNGEHIKAGLALLEQWCYNATEEYVGSAWDELKHIRQAVEFFVVPHKPKKSLDEITKDLCPALTSQQLYRVIHLFWDDKYGTHNVSSDVLSSLKVKMNEDADKVAASDSFLLDDDLSIPFTVNDLSRASPLQPGVADVDPPQQLLEHSGFSFLIPKD